MTISYNPIRTTIVYGLLWGLAYIPVSLALIYMFPGPHAVYLTFCLVVTGYSVMLSRWSKTPILICIFPALLLFLSSFQVDSIAAFYIMALVVIGWNRSGICFRRPAGMRLMVEFLIGIVAGVVMALFKPGSASAWALQVWMLFLIQSLYFVIFDNRAVTSKDQQDIDPFERASRRVEAILSKL